MSTQADATSEVEDPYSVLPRTGSHEPGVGHALITMVEPHVGHEHAYNRWYEDRHFFNGAMQEPWMFAGRRWVAPYDLQQLRYPVDSPVTQPVTNGVYLGTYWITKDRIEDHKKWTFATNARLVSEWDDVNRDRTHIYTSFQDHAGNVYASPDVPSARFSLMDPAPGLVLQAVDAPDAESRDELERWLLEDYLPTRVTPDSPVSLAMVFQVTPPAKGMKPEVYAALEGVANGGRRLTVLWFLTKDPRDVWDEFFSNEVENVRAGGKGETALVAPFIPSKMGTTLYEDQLRAPTQSTEAKG